MQNVFIGINPIEIWIESDNSCRELCEKWVPIIIKNIRYIYIDNIQATYTYQ